jgi:hypothetical protein
MAMSNISSKDDQPEKSALLDEHLAGQHQAHDDPVPVLA